MLEMMTASAKKSDLPEPTGDIQGIFQNMGQVNNFTQRLGNKKFVAYNNFVYYGLNGRTSSGTNNSNIYRMDLDTMTCVGYSVVDNVSGIQNRAMSITPDGRYITLFGGTPYSGSGGLGTAIFDTQTNTRIQSVFTGTYSNSSATGGLNGDNFIIGSDGNNRTGYKLNYPVGATSATLTTIGNIVTADTYGYSSATFGQKILLKANNGTPVYIFDMGSSVITAAASLNAQAGCDGVWDGADAIYFIMGSVTSTVRFSSLRKYTISTNTWTTIPMSGALPTSAAYTSSGCYLAWYKKAIYMFRSDIDTPEGRTLYRII